MNQDEINQLQALCEAAVEGSLTPEEQERLEQMVLQSSEARRFYVAYLHQHATLQWSAADPTFLPLAGSSPTGNAAQQETDRPRRLPAWPTPARLGGIVRDRWRWIAGMAVAAAVLIAMWLPDARRRSFFSRHRQRHRRRSRWTSPWRCWCTLPACNGKMLTIALQHRCAVASRLAASQVGFRSTGVLQRRDGDPWKAPRSWSSFRGWKPIARRANFA